jgi:hypothetical protein
MGVADSGHAAPFVLPARHNRVAVREGRRQGHLSAVGEPGMRRTIDDRISRTFEIVIIAERNAPKKPASRALVNNPDRRRPPIIATNSSLSAVALATLVVTLSARGVRHPLGR